MYSIQLGNSSAILAEFQRTEKKSRAEKNKTENYVGLLFYYF